MRTHSAGPRPTEAPARVRTAGTARSWTRLSPLDSAFLRLEDRHTSVHIASIAVFEGPVPLQHEMVTLFEHTLPLLPRYRQRLRELPFRLGQPVWADDPAFDLDRHLLRTALPAPGSSEQLQDLMGRLMTQRLDRHHPLWQCWVVDGLAEGRWAMINKIHHCLVDGIGGTDLLGLILGNPPETASTSSTTWRPRAAPGSNRLLANAAADVPQHCAQTVARIASVARRPRSTAHTAAGVLRGVTTLTGALRVRRTTSLQGTIGVDRSWAGASVDLADVGEIRRAFGGTVNDVVVAAVTRGFRELLLQRDERLPEHGLTALVPVSVRDAASHSTDNQVSAMLAGLPVLITDAVHCHEAVRATLTDLKASGESTAIHALTQGARYVPPMLTWTGLTLGFRLPQRVIDTVVTNVPGPRETLYSLGRPMVQLYPYVPIADQVRTAVAVTSYAGRLYFGVTADRDSTPDVAVLTAGIVAGVHALHDAAKPAVATP